MFQFTTKPPVAIGDNTEIKQLESRRPKPMVDGIPTPKTRMDGGLREGGANVNDVYKTYE